MVLNVTSTSRHADIAVSPNISGQSELLRLRMLILLIPWQSLRYIPWPGAAHNSGVSRGTGHLGVDTLGNDKVRYLRGG